MTTLPTYIEIPGRSDASVLPPGVFTGTQCWAFATSADRGKLQAFADQMFRTPSNGEITATVPAGVVIFTFFNGDKLSSPAQPIGWEPNREFMVGIPVILRRRSHPLDIRFGILPAWVYIGSYRGMVTGRESWGYFKNLGEVNAPKAWSSDFACTLDTQTFNPASPTTEGEITRLITVSAPASITDNPTALEGTSTEQAAAFLKLLIQHVESDAFGLFDELVALALRVVEPIVVNAFNLKQFRDVSDGTRACYQAITTSPLNFDSISHMQLLPAGLTVSIESCANADMAAVLGLADSPMPVLFGVGAHLGQYSAVAGATLWQAP